MPYYFDVIDYHQIQYKDLKQHIDEKGIVIYNKKQKRGVVMQLIRKKINSDKIKNIIDIPIELKHKMVIITIEPVVQNNKKSLSGRLFKYSDEEKIQLEKSAWAMSVHDEKENY